MGVRDYLYETTDRQAESKYPSWKDGESNLFSFLDAINKSQPIVQSQYEMVWSRWPRTRFFAKGFSVPGIAVATQEINHAGFTISIPTHVKYETTEVNFTIIADKEGYHYYDIRNMVLQSGHPLIAGDTKSEVGTTEDFNTFDSEDFIEVWVRNHQKDAVGHHWIIHDFRPTKIGDIELSQDGSGFVEFEVTGTFTHITYDCGTKPEGISEPPSDSNEATSEQENASEEEEGENYYNEGGEPSAESGNGYQGDQGDQEDQGAGGQEDRDDDSAYVYDEETGEGYWDSSDGYDVSDVELPESCEQWGDNPDLDWESNEWCDWNYSDWGAEEDSEFLVGNNEVSIKTQDVEVNGETHTMVKLQGNLTPEQAQALREGGTKALLDTMKIDSESRQEIQKEVEQTQWQISQDKKQSTQTASSQQSQTSQQTKPDDTPQVPGFKTSRLENGDYSIVKQTAFSTMIIQTTGDMAVETQTLNRLEKEYNDARAGKSTAIASSKKRMVEIQKNKMKVIQQWLDAKNSRQQKEAEPSALRKRELPKTMTQRHLNQMNSLFKAIKTNHNLSGPFIACVNPVEEMQKYKGRIMNISLPHRFGMYRPSKSMEKVSEDIELEDPGELSTNGKIDPNHKFRSIF